MNHRVLVCNCANKQTCQGLLEVLSRVASLKDKFDSELENGKRRYVVDRENYVNVLKYNLK